MPATIHFYDALSIGNPATGQVVGFDSLTCNGSETKALTVLVKLRADVAFKPATVEESECFNQNLAVGVSEYQWSRIAEELFRMPDTLHVGAGNTSGVDNAIRFSLYRSLSTLPNTHLLAGNSFMDLLTVSRAMQLLRPESMRVQNKLEWSEQQRRSFVFGNTVLEGRALAVKEYASSLSVANSSLFNHSVKYSNPSRIAEAMGLSGGNVDSVTNLKPVFVCHESLLEKEKYGIYMAIGTDPIYTGMIYMVDLTCDLSGLIARGHTNPLDFIRLVAGDKQKPVVRVNLNRVPFVSPLGVLNGEAGTRLGIRASDVKRKVELLRDCTDLCLAYMELSTAGSANLNADPDGQLLSGEYLDADIALLNELHTQGFEQWKQTASAAHDERIPILAQRLLGRNAIEQLSPIEAESWAAHCKKRLLSGGTAAEIEASKNYCRNLLNIASTPSGMRSACEHWIKTFEATHE